MDFVSAGVGDFQFIDSFYLAVDWILTFFAMPVKKNPQKTTARAKGGAPKIMLLLSFLRRSPQCIELALQMAAERKAELIVLFVLNDEVMSKVAKKLTEDGWIGGKPSEQFLAALRQEYREQAQAKIQEVEKAARAKGISLRSFSRQGDLVKEALALLNEEKIDLVIVTRRKRSRLSRFLFGSAVADLMLQAPCPVKVIDEE
jgi:nucleotide-binding universal stress UspA family protein